MGCPGPHSQHGPCRGTPQLGTAAAQSKPGWDVLSHGIRALGPGSTAPHSTGLQRLRDTPGVAWGGRHSTATAGLDSAPGWAAWRPRRWEGAGASSSPCAQPSPACHSASGLPPWNRALLGKHSPTPRSQRTGVIPCPVPVLAISQRAGPTASEPNPFLPPCATQRALAPRAILAACHGDTRARQGTHSPC